VTLTSRSEWNPSRWREIIESFVLEETEVFSFGTVHPLFLHRFFVSWDLLPYFVSYALAGFLYPIYLTTILLDPRRRREILLLTTALVQVWMRETRRGSIRVWGR